MERVVLIRSNPVSPDPPVEKMADTLLSAGYKVTVLAWDRAEDFKCRKEIVSFKNGKVLFVRFGIKAGFGAGIKSLKQLAQFQSRIKKWLSDNKNEYDIIHAFDFDTGFVANRCAKKFSKKFVYHILDFYIDSHRIKFGGLASMLKKAEFKLINRSDLTIICTEKRREQIAGSNPKRLIVVYNTPQSDMKIDEKFVPLGNSDKCKIVYVGILGGSRYILEIADFVSHDKRFEFHVAGFGYAEDKIKDYAEKNENIFFYGKIPYSQTLALEKHCDIMTAIYDPSVPNHKYAAPNKFYESLMLGKPVIMVKNTGCDDIVQENQIGYLMDFSKEGLEEALIYLYDHRNEWNDIEAKSKKLYETEYSWKLMQERILKEYSSL